MPRFRKAPWRAPKAPAGPRGDPGTSRAQGNMRREGRRTSGRQGGIWIRWRPSFPSSTFGCNTTQKHRHTCWLQLSQHGDPPLSLDQFMLMHSLPLAVCGLCLSLDEVAHRLRHVLRPHPKRACRDRAPRQWRQTAGRDRGHSCARSGWQSGGCAPEAALEEAGSGLGRRSVAHRSHAGLECLLRLALWNRWSQQLHFHLGGGGSEKCCMLLTVRYEPRTAALRPWP